MPINPAIALSVKPLEIQQRDPLQEYAQITQIQNAMLQNQLARQQVEQEQGVMNYLRGPGNLTTPEGRAGLRQFGKTGLAYEKLLSEQETAALKRQELEGKLRDQRMAALGTGLTSVMNDPSDESLKSAFDRLDATGVDTRVHRQALLAEPDLMKRQAIIKNYVSSNPEGRQALAFVQPKPGKFDLNGKIVVLDENPNSPTYMQPIKEFEKSMSAYEKGHLAVQQGQLGVAQAREQRLAQGPVGVSLSPEQNDALFGENGAVAQGKINPNRINSRNAKMWADAFMRNPNADPVKVAQEVGAADKAIKDFATGEQGKKVTAFNTAIDHLETLDQLGVALKNGDVQAINSIANTLGVKTGQPATTMYNQAARIVGGEISKAIVPGVGTGKEREETAAAFASAMSPEQLTGASATAKKLLGGQLNSLELQYSRTTKRKDFADQFLTPAARAAYMSIKPAPTAAPAASAVALPPGFVVDK